MPLDHDQPFDPPTAPRTRRQRQAANVAPPVRTACATNPPAHKERYDLPRSQYGELPQLMAQKRKIVVISGAGISAAAGIPTFRTRGVDNEAKISPADMDVQWVYKDTGSAASFHQKMLDLGRSASRAGPTLFHRLVAHWARKGCLLRNYTQNIDGLDTDLPGLESRVPLPASAPWPLTVQLHGSVRHVWCAKCSQLYEPSEATLPPDRIESCAKCPTTARLCGQKQLRVPQPGTLHPRVTLYNGDDADGEAIHACCTADAKARPDCVVIVGTSMSVDAACNLADILCGQTMSRPKGDCLWINPHQRLPQSKRFARHCNWEVLGTADRFAWLLLREDKEAEEIGVTLG